MVYVRNGGAHSGIEIPVYESIAGDHIKVCHPVSSDISLELIESRFCHYI